jgi:legumain
MKTVALALVLALNVMLAASAGEHYAVLVAGSNGFWNYRHQSDICHAYQILINNGFKPENVITFSYDDVANDSENPFPGQLFNKPSDKGVDVYAGCKIDYSGDDVTPANFLAALIGDDVATGGKKVLKSTEKDRVFINFADHGATGLIAFPNDYLYASDLLKALDTMTQKKSYSELVFYLEACESGSMFQKLPTDGKIFATSAASPDESSWAAYCSPDDVVNGIHVGSCLGDLYSVNWMEDTDEGDLEKSLHDQFNIVKTKTDLSQVMEWGDLSFKDQPIRNYLSVHDKETKADKLYRKMMKKAMKHGLSAEESKKVNSRDVKLNYLMAKHLRNGNLLTEQAVHQELIARKTADHKFEDLTTLFGLPKDILNKTVDVNNYDCLKAAVATYEETCHKFTDYSLKYVKVLANVCENFSVEETLGGIKKVCVESN